MQSYIPGLFQTVRALLIKHKNTGFCGAHILEKEINRNRMSKQATYEVLHMKEINVFLFPLLKKNKSQCKKDKECLW